MIYTMGAFSEAMPINMNFDVVEQPQEEEFTVTHLDDTILDQKDVQK